MQQQALSTDGVDAPIGIFDSGFGGLTVAGPELADAQQSVGSPGLIGLLS